MKKSILIILFLVIHFSCLSQKDSLLIEVEMQDSIVFNHEPSELIQDIRYAMWHIVKNNELDTLCIESCSYFTFQVDKKGILKRINFGKNMPVKLLLAIGSIIENKSKTGALDKYLAEKTLLPNTDMVVLVFYDFYTRNCLNKARYTGDILDKMMIDLSKKNNCHYLPPLILNSNDKTTFILD